MATLPVVAILFLALNYWRNEHLLNAVEAIPTTYLSSNTTSAAQAAGTLIAALSANGFTLGSSALVNSVGTSPTATSLTYTSDGNTSTSYTTPYGAEVFDNYLFITHNGDDRVSIYDISITDTPTYLTEFSTACTIGDILIASSTLYVTNYTGNNFRVYDLTASTTAPTFVRTVSTGSYPIGIAKSAAGYLYVANNAGNTISIFNAASSTNPTLAGTYTLPSNNPVGLAIKGTHLYVAHYNQAIVRTLSIATPASPSNVTTNAVGTNPTGVETNGQNILLVSNFGGNSISQLNITTPSAPVASGNSSFSSAGTNPAGIAFSADGKEAYVVNNGSNSFTSYNSGKEKYVAWNWKCGSTSGCDIKTWTGNGANRTIAHSLGSTPAFIMVKRTDTTGNWAVYHQSLGNTQYLLLNSNAAAASSATYWTNTSPTSANFTVGSSADVNASGGSYQAQVFAEKSGFSKFGSYTGNGSADGPFIYTGFKPKLVLFKNTAATEGWAIYDTARATSTNLTLALFADGNYADFTNTIGGVDYIANGFKIRTSGSNNPNANSGTYIYAAFAEYPFEYATTNGNGLSIATSTRFNGTNAYLSRTPGTAGSRTTWTWSGWVKRSTLGTTQQLWTSGIDSNNAALLYFDSGNRLVWQDRISGTNLSSVVTNSVYRDPSAWMQIVVAVDTTQATASDRLKIYVNGVQQSLTTTTAYSHNATGNINVSGQTHVLGRASYTGLDYYSGYLSNIHFVDGQALTPTSFAQSDSNGRWSPKAYSGTYGTNGFHLNFASSTAPGLDSATITKRVYLTNGTSWTVPSDWNNASNTIEVIGGGGGGAGHGYGVNTPYGGGGGGYSQIANLALTPGALITYQVGAAGAGGCTGACNGANGGDTWFNGASLGASSVGAKGGGGGADGVAGAGGATSTAVGTVKYKGGNGAFLGGGGGAAGPNGSGGNGGAHINFGEPGGSGGGGGGGSNGLNSNAGATGGNNYLGAGGGAINNPGTNGGGAGGNPFNGNHGNSSASNGGAGTEWEATHGSGGGGSTGSYGDPGSAATGGAGGLYGAGGGAGSGTSAPQDANGGSGAQGIIVITYTTAGGASSFTANNIAANDNVADSPTNNFPTWNPIYYDALYSGNRLTLSYAGLDTTSNASIGTSQATNLPNSGKWYWETKLTGISVAGTDLTGVGLIAADGSDNRVAWEQTYANACGAGTARGLFIVTGGTITTCSNTLTNATNDVIGIAYDADNRKVWFSSNGSFVYGGNPALGTSPDASLSSSIQWYPYVTGRGASNTHSSNFGQGGQSGLTYDSASGGYFRYTPPSGFKALSSANMIAAGTTNASLVKSNNWFDAIIYEGNGTSKVISSLNFQPDLIWIKDRTSAVNHVLFGDGTTIENTVTSFFQWFEF